MTFRDALRAEPWALPVLLLMFVAVPALLWVLA